MRTTKVSISAAVRGRPGVHVDQPRRACNRNDIQIAGVFDSDATPCIRKAKENGFGADSRTCASVLVLDSECAGGLSTLFEWAFGPRNPMKNWHHGSGESGEVVGTVEKSRPRLCLTLEHVRFCANNWASFVSLGSGDSHVPLPGNTFWHALRFAEGEAGCLIESQQWTFTRRC